MCDEKHEQRINVKFLVKLKKTPTECYNLLKEAYGENSLFRARVFEWYKRFSEGRESAEDDQRPGRPVSVSTPQTVTKINEIVRGDRRMSIRMIAETDNAPAHNALSVKRYLAARGIPVFEHPPYSPDVAPCDFFLFPKIKSALKGIRFESMEEVKRKTAELLKALTKEDFQHCLDQWKKRMEQWYINLLER
ncbi:protein GVQW3-like [Diabrotica virgifera virgifera]|uniref:Mos1 transposase HTH domain-containing protein n=1 Tax=Diabrotica virgifera virgifera TaxID=50390 RepID=A0ABM5L2R7_DIAVI|nr:protein GVQW3-like [Diabrotica virgifera virgifera]